MATDFVTLFTHTGLIQKHLIYETAQFRAHRRVVSICFLHLRLIPSFVTSCTLVNPFAHPRSLLQEFFQIPILSGHASLGLVQLYSGLSGEGAENLGSRETIRSQECCHFQDAAIVVALGELRGSSIVDEESYVGMELQGGSGDRGSNRAFNGLRDS